MNEAGKYDRCVQFTHTMDPDGARAAMSLFEVSASGSIRASAHSEGKGHCSDECADRENAGQKVFPPK